MTGGDDGLVTPTPMAALLGSAHSQDCPSCGKKLQVLGPFGGWQGAEGSHGGRRG